MITNSKSGHRETELCGQCENIVQLMDRNNELGVGPDGRDIRAWEVEAVQLGNEIRKANRYGIKTNLKGGYEIKEKDQEVTETTFSDNKDLK